MTCKLQFGIVSVSCFGVSISGKEGGWVGGGGTCLIVSVSLCGLNMFGSFCICGVGLFGSFCITLWVKRVW